MEKFVHNATYIVAEEMQAKLWILFNVTINVLTVHTLSHTFPTCAMSSLNGYRLIRKIKHFYKIKITRFSQTGGPY